MASTSRRTTRYTEAEAADRLAFADAALGAAGHEVTDPYLLAVGERFARGEISIEEAGELGRRHVLGR
ncbi:hypothetical protein GCG21_12710 [Pseudactinotalea sp. HY160]|uniref:hypothetical protein n=1 Tax=Pseudactinotalea sp. HY160 TaxID=2654490 RepID=UPI00128DB60C|nr:hypothetical protein [Pseudactinotalea sp. HY160]MPV50854.1 hypothetical protein [Pseudactinotalea sp. HY160]